MTILDTIVENKRIEILKRKQKRSLSNLRTFPHYFKDTLKLDPVQWGDKPGIIAEFKRKSPSKGIINNEVDPRQVAVDYAEAGAVAMSILTDRNFFGGSYKDLSDIRISVPQLPLLRKDFIIDPYQLHEAKAYGADIILLIAAILEKPQIEELAILAEELGLQILFEIHNEQDIEKYHNSFNLVGINNRDLNSFTVDTDTGRRLIKHLPEGVIPVSESGISDQGVIMDLFKEGFRLFLIGEHFMSEKDPGQACKRLISML